MNSFMPSEFLEFELLSNQILDYLMALGILVGGFVGVRLIRCMVLERLKRWAKRTATEFDDALVRVAERSGIPLLYLGVFYVAVSDLTLHPILKRFVDAILLVIATIFGIRLVVSTAEYGVRLYWLTRRNPTTVEQVSNALIPAIRTAAWALGIIFVLDNLGFDVSAVLAGVGIGGVALALASQGVLQDLFSYFSILLDRPIELGDFIIVGDLMGTVKHFGIKTTRIESLSGEEVVIANQDLTKSRIHNYKRMKQRRVVFRFGILYETNHSKLEKIPGIVQRAIEGIEKTRFDRAHLLEFGDFSLVYEVVYYVIGSDYNLYMDIQQAINLEIKHEFDRQGIQFAYPTQTHYLSGLNHGEPISTTRSPFNHHEPENTDSKSSALY